MADHPGDKSKQPPECKGEHRTTCPYMKGTYDGFDGERYRCERCGASYFLDYEEMK